MASGQAISSSGACACSQRGERVTGWANGHAPEHGGGIGGARGASGCAEWTRGGPVGAWVHAGDRACTWTYGGAPSYALTNRWVGGYPGRTGYSRWAPGTYWSAHT